MELVVTAQHTLVFCFAGRASPQCVLGQLMKTLFRHEELMTKVSRASRTGMKFFSQYCNSLKSDLLLLLRM